MAKVAFKQVWSDQAKADLKNIYVHIYEVSKSIRIAQQYKQRLIEKSKTVFFEKQYQVEELLGLPFRRIIFEHYKIIYKVQNSSEIRILQIFDTRLHPLKI